MRAGGSEGEGRSGGRGGGGGMSSFGTSKLSPFLAKKQNKNVLLLLFCLFVCLFVCLLLFWFCLFFGFWGLFFWGVGGSKHIFVWRLFRNIHLSSCNPVHLHIVFVLLYSVCRCVTVLSCVYVIRSLTYALRVVI